MKTPNPHQALIAVGTLALGATFFWFGLICRQAPAKSTVMDLRQQPAPASQPGAKEPGGRPATSRIVSIADVFNESDPRRRLILLTQMRGEMTRESINARIAEAEGMPASARRDELLAALYRAWGELDPQSALLAAVTKPDRMQDEMTLAILNGWITRDPANAWSWALDHPPVWVNPGRIPWEANAIRMRDLAQTLSSSGQATEALRLANDLPEGNDKSIVANSLTVDFAKYDLPSLALWISTLPPGLTRQNVLATLSNTLAAESTDYPAALVEALLNSSDQITVIGAAFREWVRTGDRTRPSQWLSEQPDGKLRNAAALGYVASLVDQDVSAAVHILDTYVSPASRDSFVTSTTTSLQRRSPAKALEWVSLTDTSAERRGHLLELVRSAPEQSRNELLTIVPTAIFLNEGDREALILALRQPK